MLTLMLSVGDKLRIAREAKYPPWSVQDVAAKVGFTKAKLHEWESGRTKNPKKWDVEKVAEALGLPLAWFYDGQPGAPPVSQADDRVTVVSDSRLVEGFSTTVAVRTWASALAALDSSTECHFEPTEAPYEIPTAFLVGGIRNMDRHDLVNVAGRSMEPVINPGDRVLFFQDISPRRNTIVMAQCPEGKVYIKVLRDVAGRWQLSSIAKDGANFEDLSGWTIHGYAVAILGDETTGRNIQWPFGQPIKV